MRRCPGGAPARSWSSSAPDQGRALSGRLEIRGAPVALLDEPLDLRVRGGVAGEALRWRARVRDDEGRVWRAEAASAGELMAAWSAAKPATAPPFAALQSLRPVALDVRAEVPDGRAAARTMTRRLTGDGVRLRRWRDGVAATLHLPAPAAPPTATLDLPAPAAPPTATLDLPAPAAPLTATLLVDATAGAEDAAIAALAAALLASRGVLVLVVREGDVGAARERLAAVPDASDAVVLARVASLRPVDPPDATPPGGPARDVTSATDDLLVPLPPGVPTRDEDPAATLARAASWDAMLALLGARPRGDAGVAQDGDD